MSPDAGVADLFMTLKGPISSSVLLRVLGVSCTCASAVWSQAEALIAAVADCFVLTFRAIASASKLPWLTLTCAAEGHLDRENGVTQFTAFDIVVVLEVPQGTNEGRALRLLEKAEKNCLITNSLLAPASLQASIIINHDAASGQTS